MMIEIAQKNNDESTLYVSRAIHTVCWEKPLHQKDIRRKERIITGREIALSVASETYVNIQLKVGELNSAFDELRKDFTRVLPSTPLAPFVDDNRVSFDCYFSLYRDCYFSPYGDKGKTLYDEETIKDVQQVLTVLFKYDPRFQLIQDIPNRLTICAEMTAQDFRFAADTVFNAFSKFSVYAAGKALGSYFIQENQLKCLNTAIHYWGPPKENAAFQRLIKDQEKIRKPMKRHAPAPAYLAKT